MNFNFIFVSSGQPEWGRLKWTELADLCSYNASQGTCFDWIWIILDAQGIERIWSCQTSFCKWVFILTRPYHLFLVLVIHFQCSFRGTCALLWPGFCKERSWRLEWPEISDWSAHASLSRLLHLCCHNTHSPRSLWHYLRWPLSFTRWGTKVKVNQLDRSATTNKGIRRQRENRWAITFQQGYSVAHLAHWTLPSHGFILCPRCWLIDILYSDSKVKNFIQQY